MSVWYAQATGSWNGSLWVTTTWNSAANGTGSPGTPIAGDVLEANGKTLNFTGTFQLAGETTPPTTILNTLGGGFFELLTNGVSVYAQIGYSDTQGITATASILQSTLSGSNVGNVIGNVYGGNASNIQGVRLTGSGTINITGNVQGGTAAGAVGANSTSTGTMIISGNATGGGNATAYGASNATGTMSISAAIASTAAPGLNGSSSSGTTSFLSAVNNANGQQALAGFCQIISDPTNSIALPNTSSGTTTLVPSGGGGGSVNRGIRTGGVL